MSNIVFILGAGASHECGAPLMNEFLDTASDLFKINQIAGREEDFRAVFTAISKLQAVHSKSQLDLNNIESIFTAFEISNLLKKLPGFSPEAIPKLINSLKELIIVTLEQKVEYPFINKQVQAPKPYDEFCSLLRFLKEEAIPKRDFSIITFNYDIAIDVAMSVEGMTYFYGLEDEVEKGHPLFKLHGSLNWVSCPKCNKVISWSLKDYFMKRNYRDRFTSSKTIIPIGTHLKANFEHCSEKVNSSPFIVPPAWNKTDQHHTVSRVWSKAAYELQSAENIFIIGYSLPETDAFFKLLFGLGTLGDTPIRNIIAFNPDETGSVEERFRKMLGPGALARFDYRKSTFKTSIPYIRKMFSVK